MTRRLEASKLLVTKALRYAQVSSKGNGHDFGIVGEVIDRLMKEDGLTAQQAGGVFSSLSNLNVFEELDPGFYVNDGDDWVQQFILRPFWQDTARK